MPSENSLDRPAFDYLASAAGLDTDDPHMDELFPYVQNAMAANEGLKKIDTTGFEPDSAFDPAHFYQD